MNPPHTNPLTPAQALAIISQVVERVPLARPDGRQLDLALDRLARLVQADQAQRRADDERGIIAKYEAEKIAQKPPEAVQQAPRLVDGPESPLKPPLEG